MGHGWHRNGGWASSARYSLSPCSASHSGSSATCLKPQSRHRTGESDSSTKPLPDDCSTAIAPVLGATAAALDVPHRAWVLLRLETSTADRDPHNEAIRRTSSAGP